MFEDEIDSLYNDADQITSPDNGTDNEHGAASIDNDPASLEALTQKLVLDLTSWARVGDTENRFLLGMDSLQVLLLTRRLRSVLKLPSLAPSTIYSNPTISGLSHTLAGLLIAEKHSQTSYGESRQQPILNAIELRKILIDKIATSSTVMQP